MSKQKTLPQKVQKSNPISVEYTNKKDGFIIVRPSITVTPNQLEVIERLAKIWKESVGSFIQDRLFQVIDCEIDDSSMIGELNSRELKKKWSQSKKQKREQEDKEKK